MEYFGTKDPSYILEQLAKFLKGYTTNNNSLPVTIPATSQVATDLSRLASTVTNTSVRTLDTWDYIPGNNKVFLNYSDTGAGANPSGNTANLKSITYKTGGTTILTRTFAYNASDVLISITAS